MDFSNSQFIATPEISNPLVVRWSSSEAPRLEYVRGKSMVLVRQVLSKIPPENKIDLHLPSLFIMRQETSKTAVIIIISYSI